MRVRDVYSTALPFVKFVPYKWGPGLEPGSSNLGPCNKYALLFLPQTHIYSMKENATLAINW